MFLEVGIQLKNAAKTSIAPSRSLLVGYELVAVTPGRHRPGCKIRSVASHQDSV